MSTEIIEAQPQEVVQANAFNVEALISEAIKQGTPVDTMERILAMRRELKAERAKEEFTKSMAAFQAECPVIEKKKKVDFTSASGSRTNYNYAPLEEIVEQVKGLLGKHGFSYTFDTQESDKAIKVFCYAKHIAGHTEQSSLTIEIDGAAKMNRTQQYGSANSYGKRYAFCNAFGIMTGDEDNDGQTPLPKQPARTAKPITPAKPATLSAITLDFISKLGTTTTTAEYQDISAAINEAKNSKAISQPEYAAIVNAAKQAVRRIEELKDQPPVTKGATQESAVSEEDIDQIAKDVGLV